MNTAKSMQWTPLRAILGLLVLVSLLCLTCLYFSSAGIAAWLVDLQRIATWQDKTSPLSAEVVQDLCAQFSLPATDPKCQPGAVVYGPDFFNTIRRAFPVDGAHPATYDQVQAKLGKYEFKREPMVRQANGLEYFVIRYDLRGDRVYPVVLFFRSDGQLFRLIADVGD